MRAGARARAPRPCAAAAYAGRHADSGFRPEYGRCCPAGLAGFPRQEITLRFAEALTPDGSLYTANLRTAKATDTFVCSGGKDTFVPRFTYHGFRYVSIAGMGGNPPLDAFTALVLGTDAAATAQFSCSSPLVNRLWANIVWGQRSNFVDVPTDCPQRDERLGWTGDAAVFCRHRRAE